MSHWPNVPAYWTLSSSFFLKKTHTYILFALISLWHLLFFFSWSSVFSCMLLLWLFTNVKQIFFAPFYFFFFFSSSSFSSSFFSSHNFGNFTFLHIDHVFTHTRNRLSSKCVKTFEETSSTVEFLLLLYLVGWLHLLSAVSHILVWFIMHRWRLGL